MGLISFLYLSVVIVNDRLQLSIVVFSQIVYLHFVIVLHLFRQLLKLYELMG